MSGANVDDMWAQGSDMKGKLVLFEDADVEVGCVLGDRSP